MPVALDPPDTTSLSQEKPDSQKTTPARLRGFSLYVFAIVIFLGAFLLFFVQLLLAKLMLPVFGGVPAVWTSCLLVFQSLLLAGYGLAHLLASRLTARLQATSILLLVSVSLVLFLGLAQIWPTPITPSIGERWESGANPNLAIMRFLLAAVGIPFLILSTTSPLLQHWSSKVFPEHSPYRFYALSNVGSLLGLLCYPFVIEPTLHLRTQAWMWTCGYSVYALCYAVCAWKVRGLARPTAPADPRETARTGHSVASIEWRRIVLWIVLGTCGSVLLLATTNHICQEVAVIPFLWVLPLGIYLLSFILAFESSRWYRRNFFHALFAVTAGWVITQMLSDGRSSYYAQLCACCIMLFAGCTVCHGEAARLRPPADRLTTFYLCLSSGGAIGGIFVSLLAPQIFRAYWEFPLGIFACAALLILTAAAEADSWLHERGKWLATLIAGGVIPLAFYELGKKWQAAAHIRGWMLWSISLALVGAAALLYKRERETSRVPQNPFYVRAAAGAAGLVLVVGLVLSQESSYFRVLARSRNFYGMLIVADIQPEDYRMLIHGATSHGFQFQRQDLRRLPTGYYGPNSGVNILLRTWPYIGPIRVGLVGMGVGTLAALGNPGDTYRFYEINKDILRFAAGDQAYFSFIRDSPAHVETAVGDARMSLEREAARGEKQHFDVLVLDAFSSDAIPLHLLTREAFELYLQHLRGPESVIAVHISNKMLDLAPVLASITEEFELNAVRIHPLWLSGFSAKSDWILLSHRRAALATPELAHVSEPFPGNTKRVLWTDDYSNLLHVLR
jgi:hypothetical protein